MSWSEIKSTPMIELQGLVKAFGEYNLLHAFDGYSEKEVNQMAQDKPDIRSRFNESRILKEKYNFKLGKSSRPKSLGELIQ